MNKLALITGGTRGIGKQIALTLAKEGYNIAINYRTENDDLKRLTSYAEKIGLAFQIKDDILSEEGNEEILGKPVGNDKQLEKCTYVSKYGLDKAKEILNQIITEAIHDLEIYDEKAEFLINLAQYIQNRNK